MRGRRPYPIPGMEPGRWQVYKMRGLPESARPGWMVAPEHCGGGVSFPTWREALDYVDRQARTREVVLPRITESKAMIPGALGLSLESGRTWDGKRNTWVRDGVSMVYVASYDLRPLALALLTLAEQEEQCGK